MGYDFETIEGQRELSFNVTGMSLILRLLHQRDVLDWDDGDLPADPELDDDDDHDEWMRAWDANQAAWEAERRAAERWRIPAAKFRSNGDWLVFPAECRLIADALRAATPADAAAVTDDYDTNAASHPRITIDWGEDRVRDLLEAARDLADYAEAAAGLGGFRVR